MIDFFDSRCEQFPNNKKNFGLRDDENGTPAYIVERNDIFWQAEVNNTKGNNGEGYDIKFIAIDKCIIKDTDFEERGRCEGMLVTELHLYLIELKHKRKMNRSGILDQLLSTIELLQEFNSPELSKFRHKKIFGCNSRKKGRSFNDIDNELQKKFFSTYGFRINMQTNIVVV